MEDMQITIFRIFVPIVMIIYSAVSQMRIVIITATIVRIVSNILRKSILKLIKFRWFRRNCFLFHKIRNHRNSNSPRFELWPKRTTLKKQWRGISARIHTQISIGDKVHFRMFIRLKMDTSLLQLKNKYCTISKTKIIFPYK